MVRLEVRRIRTTAPELSDKHPRSPLITGVCDETEHLLEGRLISQAPEIDGRLLINDGIERLGELPAFVRVEISEAHPYDVVGGVVHAVP